MPEIKNTVIEMSNAFDDLIFRLVNKERINELDDRSTYLSKLKCREEKELKGKNPHKTEHPETLGQYLKM